MTQWIFFELCSAYQMAEKKKKSERGGLTSHRRPGWGFSWLLEFSFDLTSACQEAGRAGRKDPSHDQWKLWGFWGSQQRVRVKTLMCLRKKHPIFLITCNCEQLRWACFSGSCVWSSAGSPPGGKDWGLNHYEDRKYIKHAHDTRAVMTS